MPPGKQSSVNDLIQSVSFQVTSPKQVSAPAPRLQVTHDDRPQQPSQGVHSPGSEARHHSEGTLLPDEDWTYHDERGDWSNQPDGEQEPGAFIPEASRWTESVSREFVVIILFQLRRWRTACLVFCPGCQAWWTPQLSRTTPVSDNSLRSRLWEERSWFFSTNYN